MEFFYELFSGRPFYTYVVGIILLLGTIYIATIIICHIRSQIKNVKDSLRIWDNRHFTYHLGIRRNLFLFIQRPSYREHLKRKRLSHSKERTEALNGVFDRNGMLEKVPNLLKSLTIQDNPHFQLDDVMSEWTGKSEGLSIEEVSEMNIDETVHLLFDFFDSTQKKHPNSRILFKVGLQEESKSAYQLPGSDLPDIKYVPKHYFKVYDPESDDCKIFRVIGGIHYSDNSTGRLGIITIVKTGPNIYRGCFTAGQKILDLKKGKTAWDM